MSMVSLKDGAVAPFVGGATLASTGDEAFTAVDPSTGAHVSSFSVGSVADVDAAVASARAAFDAGVWSDAPPSQRKAVLHKLADLITQEAAALDALDAVDMGKPISEPFGNAMAAAGLMRFHAEAVDKVSGDVYTSDRLSLVIQRRVPRGVVAALVPWNFPIFVAALKTAPALAAGNSVVLKPSEHSPRSALRLAQLALEAGLPSGVLNVVPGLGHTVGKALGLHMDVNMLAFTGSTAVGKLLLQYAGQSNMKVVQAECGGKSPHVVFDDGIDVDAAADRIGRQLLANQGQVCSVGSRLLVQRSLAPAVLNRLQARIGEIVMGAAMAPETTFGPVVSALHRDRVMGFIDEARGTDAELVTGGRRALEGSGGFFVEPTIFTNVPPTSRIAQEEIFGPVLAVTPFEDEAEAVRLANGTAYGLIAYVWTANLSRGLRLMKAIPSSIRINGAVPAGEGSGYAASNEPLGHSGIGAEGGMGGFEGYFRRQLVSFSHD